MNQTVVFLKPTLLICALPSGALFVNVRAAGQGAAAVKPRAAAARPKA